MFTAIHHFHRDHRAHCLRAIPIKILHNHCFQFSLVLYSSQEKSKTVVMKKKMGGGGGGVNKVHFGLGENGECLLVEKLLL